jgi:hypothetical protein
LSEINGSVRRPDVQPGDQANIYLPSETRISNGGFSAGIRSEGPMPPALVRHDWLETGAATIYTSPEASERLIIQEVSRGYQNRFSVIALQNSDMESPAQVELELYFQSNRPVVSYPIVLPAGGSELLRIDKISSIPYGSDGWARVTADRPVSAVVLTDSADKPGIYSLPGIPEASLSDKLIAPAIFRDYEFEPLRDPGVLLNSEIQILNPNPQRITARVTYQGSQDPRSSEACKALDEYVDVSIFGGQRLLLNFGGMPEGCVASATIHSSDGPIAASVRVLDELNDFEASYEFVAAERTSQPAAGKAWTTDLPIIRRNHISSRLHTPMSLMNQGEATADVRIVLMKAGTQEEIPCPEGCTMSIPAGAAHFWRPDQVSALTDGSYGSARVFSDQPLDIVVFDVAYAGQNDISSYHGLTHEGPPRPNSLPFLLKNKALDTLGQVPETLALPLLELPIALPDVNQEGRLRVPLSFRHRFNTVNRLRFGLDIDERWLRLNPEDANADGIPDAIQLLRFPENFRLSAELDESRTQAELIIEIEPSSAGSAEGLPNGQLFELWLDTTADAPPEAGWVKLAYAPAPMAWNPEAKPIPVEIEGGWQIELPWSVYLPQLFRQPSP